MYPQRKCLCLPTIFILISYWLSTILAVEPVSLSGRVISEDRHSLDNVIIISQDKYLGTTDEDGYFNLDDITPDVILSFYRYGYQIVHLKLTEIKEPWQIIMKREPMTVTGLSVRRERDSIGGGNEVRMIIPITSDLKGKSLANILNEYPDINISGITLSGERQTISILGHHTRHTLVLLDGIPLNSSGQPYDISSIPTEIIESIEIIKGGASAYKGSGALGGLININTRHPVSRYDLALSQDFGSFGLFKTSAALYHRNNWLGISLYADLSRARNDFTYFDNSDEQQIREYNDKAFQNLQVRLNGHFPEITTVYKLEIFDFDNKLPGPTNYEIYYRDARLEGINIHNYLSLGWQFNDLNPELILFYHRNRVKYDNTRAPIPLYPISSEHQDDKSGLQFRFDAPFNESYPLFSKSFKILIRQNFLLEYNREDFAYNEITNENNSIPQITQKNYAFSSLGDIIIPIGNIDWSHHLAGRIDFWKRNNQTIDRWNDFWSWRYDTAVTLYQPLSLIIGGGISRNYNLPSFYDLYWKGDSQTIGNPDLQTERSYNINTYSEFTFRNLKPRLEYHQSRVDDLIYWYLSITGWKPGNISSAEITNLKLSLDFNYRDLLNISSSWLITTALNKSRNPDGSPGDLYNKKLIYTPEESLNLTLNLRQNPFFWRISYTYTGFQWSTPDQLIPALSDYRLTNTEFGIFFKKLNIDWQLSLLLNNIFDTRYEIYAYTPQPGFNWLINLKINYKK